MSAAAPLPPTTILPWQQPLPTQVANWLINQADWKGDGPLDLSDRLVLVPTRQSGRRLREALALAAEAHRQAVFAPRVLVPESLAAEVADRPAGATKEQILVAWMRVLLEAPPAAYRSVFPIDPPKRDAAWSRRLADRLVSMQAELATGGFKVADVGEIDGIPETARWRELAELESRFESILAERELCSPVEAQRRGLAAVAPPAEISRVVIAACPDPNPMALRYLEVLAGRLPIDILVHGPDGGAAGFDAWGRPVVDEWTRRPLQLADYQSQVILAADPAHQARLVADRALAEPRPEEWLALAIVDPEITAPLSRELEDRGANVFHPEGESWREGRWYGLLQALAAVVDSRDCQAVGNLLRCPDVLAALATKVEGGIKVDDLLRHWDVVVWDHLTQELSEVLARAGTFPTLRQSLLIVAAWIDTLQNEPFAEAARLVPAEILGDCPLAADGPVAEGVQRWVEVISRVGQAVELMPQLSKTEQWSLALKTYAEGTRFGPRPREAVELGGWLEVLWADAPRMVIAGANDGQLPESVTGDAFLPETLRERLGLKTNGQRHAGDAYLMAAAAASRPDPADLTILVGKTAASGDPLRPSRILLVGDDQTLPNRVEHLFSPLQVAVDNQPWRRAWKLRPRRVQLRDTLSVTALRDWLECPFRFYLSRGLKMEAVETGKAELNAMDFGTLVHGVLEEMSGNPALRDVTDPAVLQAGLLADLEQRIRRTYGEQPALPLVIQFESARQRLRRVAALEVEERLQGWRTERVEWAFAVPLGGLTIKGKIDRIDRHEDGRYRVIDYKTSDRAADPLAKHLGTLRAEDAGRPAWLRIRHRGKERRWTDLQLPLYRRALAAEFGRDITCAYFNLPKAISETGLWHWEDEGDALQTAAEACAEGVAAAIVDEAFWPPVDHRSRQDEAWATLFHHGIAASVEENWIRQEVAP